MPGSDAPRTSQEHAGTSTAGQASRVQSVCRNGLDNLVKVSRVSSDVCTFGTNGTAYIFNRNFELVKIRRKQLHLNLEDPGAFGVKYHSLQLIDRKGWQRKLNKTRSEPTLRSTYECLYAL